MDNKKIAKYELAFIGGNPKVYRYYNEDESKHIDILTSQKGYCNNGITCASIGLNETDIGLMNEGKKLRIELIALGNLNDYKLENILSTCVFEIMDNKTCSYGMIIPNIIKNYVENTCMEHILLLSPIFWEKYSPLIDKDEIVSWLLLVPISTEEAKYIQNHGVDQFETLMEEKKVDISDYKRKSIV